MPPLRFGAAASLGLAHRRRLEAAHLSRSRRPDVHPVRVTLLARDLPQNELLEGHDPVLSAVSEAVNMHWTWRWHKTARGAMPYPGHEDLPTHSLRMAPRHRSGRPAGRRARGLWLVERLVLLVLLGRLRSRGLRRFDHHHGERRQRYERGRHAQGLLDHAGRR